MENMDSKEFRRRAHEMVDWIADYIDNVEQYPVRSQVQPREVINKSKVCAGFVGLVNRP